MEIKKCRSLNTSVIKWKKKQCHLVSQAFLEVEIKKNKMKTCTERKIFFFMDQM